jgi:hypothetical protein
VHRADDAGEVRREPNSSVGICVARQGEPNVTGLRKKCTARVPHQVALRALPDPDLERSSAAGVFPDRMEMTMANSSEHARSKGKTPNTKGDAPQHQGGDARKAQKWGGGNKAGKGPITRADKRNENSSAKT